MVASDIDWLSTSEHDIEALFSRVVPAPEHGERAMRAEIIVGVFCSDVFTVAGDDERVIKGERPPSEVVRKRSEEGRALFFRLP